MRIGPRFALVCMFLFLKAIPLHSAPMGGANEILKIVTGSGPDRVYMSAFDSIDLRLPLAFAVDGKEQVYIHDPGAGTPESETFAVPGSRIQIFRQNAFIRTIALPRDISQDRLAMQADSRDRVVVGDGKAIFRTDQWGSYFFYRLEDPDFGDVRPLPFLVFDEDIAIPEKGGYWKQLTPENERVLSREERFAQFATRADLLRAPASTETKGVFLSRNGFFAAPDFAVMKSFGSLMANLRRRKIGTLFGEISTFVSPVTWGVFSFRGIDTDGNTYWVTDPPGDRGGNGRACLVYDQFGRTIADITVSSGDLSGEPLPVIDRFGNVYSMQFWQDGSLSVVKYLRFW